MKKKLYMNFVYLIFFVLITGCAVGPNTGKITITNETDKVIRNVTIGSTLISIAVYPGQSFDYWYFLPVKGKVRVDGVDHLNALGVDPNEDKVFTSIDMVDLDFDTNMWVSFKVVFNKSSNIGLSYSGNTIAIGDSYLTLSVSEQGASPELRASSFCSE